MTFSFALDPVSEPATIQPPAPSPTRASRPTSLAAPTNPATESPAAMDSEPLDHGLPLDAEPADFLLRAFERWPGELALATSLQAEGLVMLDMLHRRTGGALEGLRVLTLDTGRIPEETHGLIDRVRERYGVPVEVHAPEPAALAALVAEQGSHGFRRSTQARKACCQVRKIEPLRRALVGVKAWISGLRREQSSSRSAIEIVEPDARIDGLLKLNPLADWTWDQVWTYVREHDVPYHPFYDRGYTSIGCAPCTRAIRPWEDRRAGRWWWEADDAKECGLHWARSESTQIESTQIETTQSETPLVALGDGGVGR